MKNESKVKDLIQIANDGATFYAHALKHVEDPHLRRVFTDMGQHKRELVASLRQALRIDDATVVEGEGTFAGMFRRASTDMPAMLGGNDAKVYVGQLEETEDRLLDSLRDTIGDIDDPKVVAILQSHPPQVMACHDQMWTLKAQMATRSFSVPMSAHARASESLGIERPGRPAARHSGVFRGPSGVGIRIGRLTRGGTGAAAKTRPRRRDDVVTKTSVR